MARHRISKLNDSPPPDPAIRVPDIVARPVRASVARRLCEVEIVAHEASSLSRWRSRRSPGRSLNLPVGSIPMKQGTFDPHHSRFHGAEPIIELAQSFTP